MTWKAFNDLLMGDAGLVALWNSFIAMRNPGAELALLGYLSSM